MDQTAFKNQILFGTIRNSRENSSMDCSVCICLRRHCQEEIYAPVFALRNITDFKHLHF